MLSASLGGLGSYSSPVVPQFTLMGHVLGERRGDGDEGEGEPAPYIQGLVWRDSEEEEDRTPTSPHDMFLFAWLGMLRTRLRV